MNKILIEIKVPQIEQSFDIYVPITKKVIVIDNLIKKTIKELSENYLNDLDNLRLYYEKNGKIISYDTTIKSSGIKNGEVLILI